MRCMWSKSKSRYKIEDKHTAEKHRAYSRKASRMYLKTKITYLKVKTLYFLWFNVSRLFLLHYLFNILRILFVSFGSIFQDFSSLTHTKNSLHFHSSFSLLLLYIHVHSLSYHPISTTHLDKKWCHFASTFKWHLHNSNIAVSFDRNPYE